MSNIEDIRNLGVVKWFDSKKGFGFISNCTEKTDIFVHFSGIKVGKDELKVLYEGEYVSYDKIQTQDKSVAQNVTGVCGGELLSQNGKRIIFLAKKNVNSKHVQKNKNAEKEEKKSNIEDGANDVCYPLPNITNIE
jgi:CspA family cold shock protein